VEGEKVVFHFYHVFDTCKLSLKNKFTLAWKRGKPREKYYEHVTFTWIIKEVANPFLGLYCKALFFMASKYNYLLL